YVDVFVWMVFWWCRSVETYFSRASKYTMVAYVYHIYVIFLLVAVGFYGRTFDPEYANNPVPMQIPSPHWISVGILTPHILMFPPIARVLGVALAPPFLSYFFTKSAKTKPMKPTEPAVTYGTRSEVIKSDTTTIER
ncbi:hypothetical protein AAMO2058_001659700, partial [Amorphochlora amoebiformis]